MLLRVFEENKIGYISKCGLWKSRNIPMYVRKLIRFKKPTECWLAGEFQHVLFDLLDLQVHTFYI
jgi:hypothetical protein